MRTLWVVVAGLTPFLVANQTAQDELKPGLVAEVFKMGQALEDFPAIPADRKATVRRVDKQISYDSTSEPFPGIEMSDHFYIRWTGVIRVPKEAKYTFFTESDDGSRLQIDGRMVVDNGGLHGMEEKSGEVELKAGNYDIRVELFENDGEAGCRVSWEADGIPKEIIPDGVFFHKKDKELDK